MQQILLGGEVPGKVGGSVTATVRRECRESSFRRRYSLLWNDRVRFLVCLITTVARSVKITVGWRSTR